MLANDIISQVCERSLSGSGGGPNATTAHQFVRAEMLSSGYLIRPCDGGGSIVHIVDHLDLEVLHVICLSNVLDYKYLINKKTLACITFLIKRKTKI